MSVTALIGNPRPASRTRAAALRLARRIAAPGPAAPGEAPAVTAVDLADFGPDLLRPGPPPAVQDALGSVRSAGVLVVASPTYKATYTGLLKVFADLLPSGALEGVTAVPLLVMASTAHAHAVDAHLRPLLAELGAEVPAPGAVLLADDIDGGEEGPAPRLDRALGSWFDRAGPALAAAR